MSGGRGRPAQPVPAELVDPLRLVLDEVRELEVRLVAARLELGRQVRVALDAGASHRAIAAVLGVRHGRVAEYAGRR